MSKSQWAMVVILVGAISLAVYAASKLEDAQERPEVQLKTAHIILQDHARVIAAYQQANADRWPPNLIALRGFSKEMGEQARLLFTSNKVPDTKVFYRYRVPLSEMTEDGQLPVVMASVEPMPISDDPDSTSAVHPVLLADLSVVDLSLDDLRQRADWLWADGDDSAADRPAHD